MKNQYSYRDDSGKLRSRNEIDDKYKWNLKDIFESDELWEENFNSLQQKADKLSEFKGTLHQSAENLLACLKYDEEIGIILDKLHLYSMLSKDIDLGKEKYQGMYDRLIVLASKISALSAFIKPEILQIPEENIYSFIESDEGLKIYRHLLDDLLRTKIHTLSEAEEIMLANASPALQTSYNTFGLLNNADLKFPKIEDENGSQQEISHARYTAAMYSLDRDYRKRFYKNYYKPFMEYKNTFGSLFNGNLKSDLFLSTTRKYNSTRELALDANNIPLSVYDNLVNSVNDRLDPLHRWAELKKRYLDIGEFHAYDAYVTLFPSVKKKYSYEDGIKIVCRHNQAVIGMLQGCGKSTANHVAQHVENHHIGVFEKMVLFEEFDGLPGDVATTTGARRWTTAFHAHHTVVPGEHEVFGSKFFAVEVNFLKDVDHCGHHAVRQSEGAVVLRIAANLQNTLAEFGKGRRQVGRGG